MGRGWDQPVSSQRRIDQKRAAIIGSGPAGLACAGDLARNGVTVTIFEALHVAGGVLKYGIPEFRLPGRDHRCRNRKPAKRWASRSGSTPSSASSSPSRNCSATWAIDAAFVGTGAGSPKFAGIPGEAFNGVFSANEFLTRVNLMRGHRQPIYDTPVGMGKRVAVVGAGNTAMDSARVALRMGAESVTVVYRRIAPRIARPHRGTGARHRRGRRLQVAHRSRWRSWATRPAGSPACAARRWSSANRTPPGAAAPCPSPARDFLIDVDTVIYALGTTANPIIAQTTPGLAVNKWGYISIDENTGMTSIPGVFAGGDIVTGAATVILAMGAGKRAAQGMLRIHGSHRIAGVQRSV